MRSVSSEMMPSASRGVRAQFVVRRRQCTGPEVDIGDGGKAAERFAGQRRVTKTRGEAMPIILHPASRRTAHDAATFAGCGERPWAYAV